MRVLSLLASAVAAFAAIASAQNPFTYPVEGNTLHAGETVNLKWDPTTGGTVSLVARNGNPSALNTGTTFASQIPNSGSYSWTISPTLINGAGWTVQIVDDQNPNIVNYTPTFSIAGGSASSAASTGSMASTVMSTAMSTMTGSATMTASASMTSSTVDMMSTMAAAASTVMASDPNSANEYRAQSGFAAVAALVGVVAML